MKIIYNPSQLFKPAIFLDRDGVINRDVKGKYITSIDDVKIYKTAVEGLKKIDGYHLIILTNQSAVGRGMMSLEMAININNYIVDILRKKGVIINSVYFCPHSPEENCSCRKPATGMIDEAMKDFKIDIKNSIIVGDKTTDIELGRKVGIKSIMVLTGQGRHEISKLKKKPFAVISNLLSLKSAIKLLLFIVLGFKSYTLGFESPLENIFKKSNKASTIERFEYEIYWGVINVGSAEIEIDEVYRKEDDSKAYMIKTTAKSSAFINKFFKVDDTNISYVSTDATKSFGYIKNINEGKYSFFEYTVFDYNRGIFYGEHISKNKITKHSGEIKGWVHDALSALFLVMRSDDPTKVKSIDIATRKLKKIDLIFHGIEKVKTPVGRFYAYKIEPTIGEDGIFVAKKGKSMYVYISKNERFPVLLEAEVFIGSVKAILVKHVVIKNRL